MKELRASRFGSQAIVSLEVPASAKVATLADAGELARAHVAAKHPDRHVRVVGVSSADSGARFLVEVLIEPTPPAA